MTRTTTFKEYKTMSQLCEYLKDKKRVVDAEYKNEILKNRTYVSVVNPFKRIFASGEDLNRVHIYKNDIKMVEYEKLVYIDDLFSVKYQQIIGNFERKLKLEIISLLCKHMFDSGDIHCSTYTTAFAKITQSSQPKNETMPYGMIGINLEHSRHGIYPVKNSKIVNKRLNLLSNLVNTGLSKVMANNNLIRHYQRHYQIVPFWLIAQILSLGEVATLFKMMSINDRNQITKMMAFKKSVSSVDSVIFSRHLDRISALRNTINHYEPVFPFFCSFSNRQELISSLHLLNLYDTNVRPYHVEKFDTSLYLNSYNKIVIENLETFISFI